ncbi:MAG: protoporphyrinogen oxidase [Candidatus Saccharimonas sp.]|nr:protoporphyrinogen oxidase [Planctomycetaceae bacterium]
MSTIPPPLTPQRIAIIGGGLAGLAAAHRLSELAQERGTNIAVTLFESGPRLGGVIGTERIGGCLIDTGADSFLTNKPAAVNLCRRLGIEDRLIPTSERHRGALVLFNGRPCLVPEGFQLMSPTAIWPMLTTPILSLWGKLRLLMEYFVPPREAAPAPCSFPQPSTFNPQPIADESLASFVRRRFGREALERLVQPLVGGIYTSDPEKLSLAATMPRFLEMERDHGSLLRATLFPNKKADGQQPTADGSPSGSLPDPSGTATDTKSSGARYGLFAGLAGGMEDLLSALRSRVEATCEVKLNAPVARIVRASTPESKAPHTQTLSPEDGGEGTKPLALKFALKQLHGRQHLIGRMRLSVTEAAPPVRLDAVPERIAALLATPREQRSETQRVELTAFQQLEEVERELALLPQPTMIYAAAADFEPDGGLRPPPGPRPIHVLHRGDIRHPRESALPGALACVKELPSRFELSNTTNEAVRRAALAKWLTDTQNSLTWRSIVNRVWHHHFGRGLVGTLNDFGHMGETPSHPELLDWLAVEFRDGGQSLKQLHRMIVMSETYRQSAERGARSAERKDQPPDSNSSAPRSEFRVPSLIDADNRLLWRMNRTRLDAECVRDAVVAVSGRLDLRMGGPSDRQFDLQPGIHVTPKIDYAKFDLNSDLGRRRSVYRFLFRTLPDPFMETLDCPSGDQITPARTNSVTVQQALALWNDAFIARHCEFIAARIEKEVLSRQPSAVESISLVNAHIDLAVRLILCRPATDPESRDLSEYASKHGLANVCRLLLNSNEFLFVN